MAHTSQTEIERKYAVEGDRALPSLEGVGQSAGVAEVTTLEPFTLEAVYFDTAELALARARIALRRREGGHDAGWHVKLPAAEGRTELQWPLGSGDPSEVPAEVADTVRVHVRDHRLTPLARIVTTRRVTELRDVEGGLVAEIADDTVQATDARQGTARVWHEWEAELGPAGPATAAERTTLLDEIERHLLAAGATVSPSVSKLAQALGRTGLGSDEPAPSSSSASAKPTAADVVRAGVAELVQRLVELDPAVRRDDEDAVHRFRTTVRRLRNVLAIHRGLFDDAVVAGLRDRLSRLGAVLGEVRDLEVRTDWASHELDAFARERGIDDPDAVRRLVEDTRAEHAEAHQRLVRVLGQGPYFRLLEDLEEFVGVGAGAGASGADAAQDGKTAAISPKKEAKKAVKRTGRRALTRAARIREALPVLSDGAGDRDADGPELVAEAEAIGALHDSRKAARRLRHAAEFSTDGPAAVLGSSVATVGESAEDLQDALGRHRDASLFAEFVLLTSRRAEAAGEGSFTYGVLYQRSLDQARQALDAADAARKALRRLL
jgi:CHAD domain-containing protein